MSNHCGQRKTLVWPDMSHPSIEEPMVRLAYPNLIRKKRHLLPKEVMSTGQSEVMSTGQASLIERRNECRARSPGSHMERPT